LSLQTTIDIITAFRSEFKKLKENKTIYHVLNETGNILLRSDLPAQQPLPQFVQKKFSRGVILCSAINRALSSNINPITKRPYSIYNYHAINLLLLGTKQFEKILNKEISFTTKQVSVDFGHEFYKNLFDVHLNHKNKTIVSSILSSISREALRMIENQDRGEDKVGHITFILDYINGKSRIYIKSVFISCEENKESLQKAPCHNTELGLTSWKLQIEDYLFIDSKY
jgi:hypothetical protein